MDKKLVTLQEARATKKLKRFIADHPSEGDADKFDALLGVMASGKPARADRTSDEASGED